VTSIVSVTDSEQVLEDIGYLHGRVIVVAALSADSIAGSPRNPAVLKSATERVHSSEAEETGCHGVLYSRSSEYL
jgi:hypothetical protein